jgi:hypothetical protein
MADLRRTDEAAGKWKSNREHLAGGRPSLSPSIITGSLVL